MLTACMLGERFLIVTFASLLCGWFRDCVAMHRLEDRCAGVVALDRGFGSLEDVRETTCPELVTLANAAIADRDADVAILAGAPLAGLARRARDLIHVPVIDPIVAAVKQAEALVALGTAKPSSGSAPRQRPPRDYLQGWRPIWSTLNDRERRSRLCIVGRAAIRSAAHFGRTPPDLSPARISQVAVESSGRVHVLRRGDPPVLVYEPEGAFVRSYGAGEIFDSHGISIDAWNRVWVADRDAHQIVAFDLSGQTILRIGERHHPKWEAPFNHPIRAAVAPDGAVLVADGYGNARIHEFSPVGEWRSSFGEIGAGPRQFMTPHSVIVDRDQRLLVCDRENDRVQVFTREGQWLADWRGLCRPMDLCEREDGVVLVTDQVPSVTAFAPDSARIDRSRPSLKGGSRDRSRTDRRDLPSGDRTFIGDKTRPGLSMKASGRR